MADLVGAANALSMRGKIKNSSATLSTKTLVWNFLLNLLKYTSQTGCQNQTRRNAYGKFVLERRFKLF